MIRQIEDVYEQSEKDGKVVLEVLVSPIGYEHLKSELQNKKEQPVWVDRLKVKEGQKGFALIVEKEQ